MNKSEFFKDKKVLVAGGTGMVGSYLTLELLRRQASVRVMVHERPHTIQDDKIEYVQGNLRNMDDCLKAVAGSDIVCNSAAITGGVMLNKSKPADLFTANLLINTQLLEAARIKDVDRFLLVSNNSVYSSSENPSTEDESSKGQPDESVFAYGWVKRFAELQAKLFSDQYGLKIAISRGTNSYGRWDKFDPQTSHVIPALILKTVRKENPFVVWGSGRNVRDFIHANDLARAMLLMLERHAICVPINIGTGKYVTINDLVTLIMNKGM